MDEAVLPKYMASACEAYILSHDLKVEDPGEYFEIEDKSDGKGPQIVKWNHSSPMPSREELLDFSPVLLEKHREARKVLSTAALLGNLRMTTAKRDSIPRLEAEGMLIYNSSVGRLQVYSGGEWRTVAFE